MEKFSNPKVSILVPVYGVEKYIYQCAKSLFEQDYQNIEYVFVNDCTKDRSFEVLQKTLKAYPHRASQVKIINHKENKGLAAARNTALENAIGEFVMPLDSDDFLSCNTAVSELMAKAVSEDDDAVFYDMQFYPRDMSFPKLEIPLNPVELTKKILQRETYLSLCGGLYKRALFMDNGIRSLEQVSMGEDYAIKPRLTYYAKKIGYLSQPFYCYRQENIKSITKNFRSKHIDDLRTCIDEFIGFFSTKPDYEEYKDAIRIGEYRCKIQCLRLWASMHGEEKDFYKIQSLFPNEVKIKLSFSDFLISKFAKYRLIIVLKFCMCVGRKIKHLL